MLGLSCGGLFPPGPVTPELQLGDLAISSVTVATAAEAASVVRDGADFDVVLLDARAAGPDGVDLVTTLQLLPAGMRPPLVLPAGLGAQITPEPPGFAAVINKPVKSAVLRQTLTAVLAPRTIEPSARHAADASIVPGSTSDTVEKDEQRQRILLVEDNLINQKVAQLMLKKLGHWVDTVGNGQEAVDAALAIPYDVILMDVQMPVMNGLDAIRRIRSSVTPGGQPYIIAMTASALLEDRAECLAAGMDSHLPKPFARRS